MILAAGDEGRTKFGKILTIIISLFIAVPFLLVGIGFIVAGFFADPAAVTDDGFSLQMFFFIMGGGFLVATGGILVLMFGLLWFFRFLARGLEQRKQTMAELQARGVKGTATVVELIDTGMLINYNPRVTLVLNVVVERQPSYQLRKTETIPMIRLPQVQPGQTIEVLVDPDDRQNPDRVILMLK